MGNRHRGHRRHRGDGGGMRPMAEFSRRTGGYTAPPVPWLGAGRSGQCPAFRKVRPDHSPV